ncbi:MAG: PhzF family phenazine biosynthesis protein [Proteobacteria bacterium]|nr:PhzF family phenazine biosynthesis protein [Pseudomonadota bacterium]
MKYSFIWVDAFTDQKFGGNPCAVFLSADALSDRQMLALAKETNLSETAFIVKSKSADFGARYFTPSEEIPLAGHPTIATIRSLIEARKITMDRPHKSISLELKAGIVAIDIFREGEDAFNIVMSQKKPEFLLTHDRKIVADLFGINESDLLPDCPVQTVSTGTPQLMVPVRTHDALQRARMNVSQYKAYKTTSDFFSPHLFCVRGITNNGTTFARHFGVPSDTTEDSFTGSATGGMAAYLWHYGLIEKSNFVAEQGHWMGRPGKATVEVVGRPENIETVKVGGKSVIVAKGEFDV